jgi:hypothetical protein
VKRRNTLGTGGSSVPLAEELEALAQFIRYSTTAAAQPGRNGGVTTYSLAQRLARQKRYAHLKPDVADMRQVLRLDSRHRSE